MNEKNKPPQVFLKQAFSYWFKLGFINFGGPAGQIVMMHKDIVESRKGIDESMLLPGPEAHQLAMCIGWRLNGYLGGFIAGMCFLLPSTVLMLILAWLAAAKGQVPVVSGIFHGISAAVVAIVVEALFRLSKKSLKNGALFVFV